MDLLGSAPFFFWGGVEESGRLLPQTIPHPAASLGLWFLMSCKGAARMGHSAFVVVFTLLGRGGVASGFRLLGRLGGGFLCGW